MLVIGSFGKHVDVYLAVSTCFNLYYTLLRSLPYPRCSGHSMDRSSPWLLCERSERSTTNLFEPAAVHAFIIFSLAECACQPTLALSTILSFRKDGPGAHAGGVTGGGEYQ